MTGKPYELYPLFGALLVISGAGIPLFLAWVAYRAIRKVMG